MSLPEEQLLELLVQLQKTTPDQARTILNGQPQITYAVMPLMIKMDLVNLEVLQATLANYAAPAATVPAVAPVVPPVPPHLMHAPYHTPTPPLIPPQVTPVHSAAPSQYPPVHQLPLQPPGYPGSYNAQQPQRYPQPLPSATPPNVLEAVGNVPEDQRAMILQVIQMTPDQLNRLPPQERAITLQLRATLGISTD